MNKEEQKQQGSTPVLPFSIYPTFNTVDEVISYANAHLPVVSKNQIKSIIGICVNTVLKHKK